MKTKTVTFYLFDELSPTMQQEVLRKYMDIALSPYWWHTIYHDFHALAYSLGIDVDLDRTYFSGFGCPGQGSSFEAYINVAKLIPALHAKAWTEKFPHVCLDNSGVTQDMLRVARLIASEKIDWPLRVRPVNRETSVTVERIPSINGRRRRYWRIQGTLELMENVIEELCRALNHQLFFALRVEHDYLTSESAIRETIRSNQYYFTENGQMEYGY